MTTANFVFVALAALAGIGIGYFTRQLIAQRRKSSIEAKLKKLVEDAKREAQEITFESKNRAVKIIEESQRDIKSRTEDIRKAEDRLRGREETLDKKLFELDERQRELDSKIERVKVVKTEIESLKQEITKKLEQVAGMTREDAIKMLTEQVEKESGEDVMVRIRKLENAGMEELERKAKNILAAIIQRLASATTSEVTTTTVPITSDDIKGKVIGREGRNIRAFERAAGVEVIVDDTPGAIVISGFDPVRRHIAKLALENLIADGRIQPARIEEFVEKSKAEIEKQIREAGKAAAYEIGAFDIDERLLHLLGRLKFRTSFGQNVLTHSIEMAHMAGMLAEELGGDKAIAQKGALVHDIGKAVDHEVQGTHVEIGRRILQKFGVDNRIVQAMQSHHEEYPYETLESIIVQTADAISAGRPGARRDSVENYLKRLQDLEAIANSFDGVEKTYAIQAGREIRIFVSPEKISDLEARNLARQIALRVENELKYPGEIKVHVIRETRVIDFAR
ncbi:MAG: ribonuclease Y [Candidatus Sungbacteria bacterium]|nr:ribonuclease Y [Candidatus Sungbacteria bacterium]